MGHVFAIILVWSGLCSLPFVCVAACRSGFGRVIRHAEGQFLKDG